MELWPETSDLVLWHLPIIYSCWCCTFVPQSDRLQESDWYVMNATCFTCRSVRLWPMQQSASLMLCQRLNCLGTAVRLLPPTLTCHVSSRNLEVHLISRSSFSCCCKLCDCPGMFPDSWLLVLYTGVPSSSNTHTHMLVPALASVPTWCNMPLQTRLSTPTSDATYCICLCSIAFTKYVLCTIMQAQAT